LPLIDHTGANFWRTPPRKRVIVSWLTEGLAMSLKAHGAAAMRVME
jgi:hypothetical protein